MNYLRESFLYRIYLTLAVVLQNSVLLFHGPAWLCRQADGSFLARQCRESAVLRLLLREGALARAWPESRVYRAADFLVNLPGWLLHKLYTALKPVFDHSFFAGLVFAMGEQTAIAQSWLIMLLWSIPYARWNNAYSLLGFALLLMLFYAGSMRRESFRLDVKHTGVYPILVLAGVLLGAVLSYAPSLSWRFLIYHAAAALCVLVTVSAVRDGEDLKRLAAGGAFCVLTSSLYAVYQRIQGVDVRGSYVDAAVNEGMPGRVYSFFDNPNTFAFVLMMLLPLVLAMFLCSKRLVSKLAAAGAFAAGIAAIAMTYSRASWIGIVFALVVMLFLWKPKLIPVFAAVCVACIPFLPATIWNRILTIGNMADTSTASRFPLYQTALAAIARSPFVGTGLGTEALHSFIADYGLSDNFAYYAHVHNTYLEVWLEAGLLGVVGLVGSLAWVIKRAGYAVRWCAGSTARVITCAAAAALCGAAVCGLADYLWHYPRVMCIFWFVFAVAAAGVKICRQESAAASWF